MGLRIAPDADRPDSGTQDTRSADEEVINDVDGVIPASLADSRSRMPTSSYRAEQKFVRRRNPKRGKVSLISGGGSRHEPPHAGLSVTECSMQLPRTGLHVAHARPDGGGGSGGRFGGGVLYIVKNYEGDVMNFEMAAELAEAPVARDHR
jgi:dihydroxyacetone kinase-like protein